MELRLLLCFICCVGDYGLLWWCCVVGVRLLCWGCVSWSLLRCLFVWRRREICLLIFWWGI